MTFDVTSASNERIKRLIRLRERKHREEEGVFLVEGARLVERALETGLEPLEIYADGSVPVPNTDRLVTVEPTALDRASYRRRSEGVIAVFDQFPLPLDRLRPGVDPLVLVAEAIEKPGNLGAMLRTADATGASALIAIGRGVDPFNPNVIRASTGALFTVPLAICLLPELVSWLSAIAVPLVVATPDAASPYWDHDLAGGTALMVGAEKEGLSSEALQAAAHAVSIPMSGSSDSLNASVSLALLAYEAVRQRSTPGR